MVGRQVDKVILFPQNGVLNAGKWTKSAGRRGFDSLRARRFFQPIKLLYIGNQGMQLFQAKHLK